MQNNLVKGCGNYSLDKQYSCQSYINTNPLSWVGIECSQSMENWKTSFPMSSSFEEHLTKINLIHF